MLCEEFMWTYMCTRYYGGLHKTQLKNMTLFYWLTIMIGPGGDSKAWGVFYRHQQGFAHCIDRTQLMGSVQSLLSKLLDSIMYSRSTLIIRSLNVLWHKRKFQKFHIQKAKVFTKLQSCESTWDRLIILFLGGLSYPSRAILVGAVGSESESSA